MATNGKSGKKGYMKERGTEKKFDCNRIKSSILSCMHAGKVLGMFREMVVYQTIIEVKFIYTIYDFTHNIPWYR